MRPMPSPLLARTFSRCLIFISSAKAPLPTFCSAKFQMSLSSRQAHMPSLPAHPSDIESSFLPWRPWRPITLDCLTGGECLTCFRVL
ncbi:uncharacterized protein LY89DRAFT_87945 [Mollisia scopiformis]|uniref:Uncharacterized protein n=1 Tax=Mollisia scopiformis TaxID=149040 RepID=A0A194X9Z9_MOLSC|nr:uncharacterized protein LY89DRAFT_87945 [Mollisia scopiformis]KUJ16597.1 hypothetical protein LY89DRAFT_87945 [Mollisia scopiformis]